ncbi:MAG: disulfide oxidoreductase [Rhodospirillales bacterium]|nr:disulfide oxidoreductase [Rhodospirillales bacterium]
MRPSGQRSRVVAVLGPTNTGKTHLALERMLGHRSGMIGFPLRLLARENYDRVVRAKGAGAVALLTGEEKIVPPRPAYFVSTVEAMPLDRRVAFLAVDEIQLCADPDRGHIFTDRLLHARGEEETMFLGADTIRPLLRRLVPEAEFLSRPRFSQLSYTGERKLTRLPPRSAVVAFSAGEVYAMAELIRRQRGGTAVVMGALSPRTRNAQVGLYQAGEVDYLVATDAIGMGLNMDVDHVAFAALRKFDGRVPRDLEAAELAQIAGRAGRHMNDGTFGTTAEIGGIPAAAVDAIEAHAFPPLRRLFWRNPDLHLTSVPALLASLAKPPDQPGLVRAREADDHLALVTLARDAEIRALASHLERVKLLWEVCRIPDFRKVMAETHTRLLGQIYRHLTSPRGRLPDDWLHNHVRRLDRTDGDIETIITRIANVRTWTYVSHRGDWVADPVGWQERTRAVEDRLSDALHDRLTQRFVDRRTAVLVRRLKDSDELLSAVARSGEVVVEGHHVGRLEGFRFIADVADGAHAAKAVSAAAQRALRGEIRSRVAALATEGQDAFALLGDGVVTWRGAPVARLTAGAEPLKPGIDVLATDLLDGPGRETVRKRLVDWLAGRVEADLGPLLAVRRAALGGAARGLAFQLCEALGSLPSGPAARQIAALDADDRRRLARLGIRLGVESVFMPALLKPAAQGLRALLWAAHKGVEPRPPPSPGRVTVPVAAECPAEFYEAVGYRVLGRHAVRVDMLERFAAKIRGLAREGEFTVPQPLATLLGLSGDDLGGVLDAMGYRQFRRDDGSVAYRSRRHRPRPSGRHRDGAPPSPFDQLRKLVSNA